MKVVDWKIITDQGTVTALYENVTDYHGLPEPDEGAIRSPDEKWRAEDDGTFPSPEVGWFVFPELTDNYYGGIFLRPPPVPMDEIRKNELK